MTEALVAGEVIGEVAQFGAAGLIALMWLSERRSGAAREARLVEAHGRLMEQREQLTGLLDVISENTKAMTALEASQRALAHLVEDQRGRAAG